jgi:hypothetical protein
MLLIQSPELTERDGPVVAREAEFSEPPREFPRLLLGKLPVSVT